MLGEVHAREVPNLADHRARIVVDAPRKERISSGYARRACFKAWPMDAARLAHMAGCSNAKAATSLGRACRSGWITRMRLGFYRPKRNIA